MSSTAQATLPAEIMMNVKKFSFYVSFTSGRQKYCEGPSIYHRARDHILDVYRDVYPGKEAEIELVTGGSTRVKRLHPDTLGVDITIIAAKSGPDGADHYAAAYQVQLYRHTGDEEDLLSGITQSLDFGIRLFSSTDRVALCEEVLSSIRKFVEHSVLRGAVVDGKWRTKNTVIELPISRQSDKRSKDQAGGGQ